MTRINGRNLVEINMKLRTNLDEYKVRMLALVFFRMENEDFAITSVFLGTRFLIPPVRVLNVLDSVCEAVFSHRGFSRTTMVGDRFFGTIKS